MIKKFTFLWVVFVCLFNSQKLFAQQTFGLFSKTHDATEGYTLFSPNGFPAHYLIDKCGKLVNKWTVKKNPGLDAFLLPNGNLLSTGNTMNPHFPGAGSAGGLLEIYSWDNKLLWSYTISDSLEDQNHDVYPMPNGNILVAIWDYHTDKEAISMGRDSATGLGQWCAKVEEIQPMDSTHANIVWQWRMWDHLIQDRDSTKPNYGKIIDHPERLNINFKGVGAGGLAADWTHLNSVTYNPALDQVMISLREMNEIYVIDHSTNSSEAASKSGGKRGKGGDILYRWGNPIAYNRGTKADEQLFVQHNATWIPKGYLDENKIMIFNDGTGRPGGNYSSIDIISPPVNANGDYQIGNGQAFGPAGSYWTYKAPNLTDFYSVVEGGVQRLLNGHTLICESTKGNFFEIDSSNNIVWRYVNPVGPKGPMAQGLTPVFLSNGVYRAVLYDTSYSAFAGKKLVAGSPIELNPLSYACTTVGVDNSAKPISYQFKIVNPFSDVLSLSTSENIENATISIYDITGKCMQIWNYQNFDDGKNMQFHVSPSIRPGIYLLKIINEKGEFNSKIIHN